MVVPAVTGSTPTNPQNTAVCAGYEFTENSNHCLKIANVNNAPWPYAATCPNLAASNFLRTDPDRGMWTWPRNPAPVTYFEQSSGGPYTLNSDGTPMWFGTSITVTEPTGCMPARMLLEGSFYCAVNLPASQYTRFNAELGGSQMGGLGAAFVADAERYAWEENAAQTEYMNTSDTLSVVLTPGQTYTVWMNIFVTCGAQTMPLATPAQLASWRIEVAGTMWPAGGA